MEYVKPLFTQEEVDIAGRILAAADSASRDELQYAIEVFSNWRAAHNYPLNGISIVLKQRASRVAGRPINPVQRLKRIESVEKKLRVRSDITLSSMQDIGGCRAILGSVAEVRALRDLYAKGNLTHELKQQNDYIERPKKDGYRGIHLIYYFGGKEGNERARLYADRRMQVEIQIRTMLQHYWATAVETAETFTRTPMKSQRDENTTPWRQFFARVSSCFAYEEGCPLVPKMTKDIAQVRAELRELEQQYRFCDTLSAYTATAQIVKTRDKAKYFLVELDLETREVNLKGFRPAESAEAARAYTATEQGALIARSVNTVLVSAKDISQLKRAYPNYFLDTTEFVARVRDLTA
jgi:ppGpp synthetase/RelA/SpoT-type nucleotidyltranferase